MNFISRDTDYAIRALVYMTKMAKKNNNIFTVDEIVREEDLPERFLRRILQKVAKKGLLCSHKGKEGGFSLSKAPKDIRLTDIIKVFQGDVDLTNCFLRGEICPNTRTCALRKKLKEIGRGLDRELRGITIASLV